MKWKTQTVYCNKKRSGPSWSTAVRPPGIGCMRGGGQRSGWIYDWILVKLTLHSQGATQETHLCNWQLFWVGLIEPPPNGLLCISRDGIMWSTGCVCSFCLSVRTKTVSFIKASCVLCWRAAGVCVLGWRCFYMHLLYTSTAYFF